MPLHEFSNRDKQKFTFTQMDNLDSPINPTYMCLYCGRKLEKTHTEAWATCSTEKNQDLNRRPCCEDKVQTTSPPVEEHRIYRSKGDTFRTHFITKCEQDLRASGFKSQRHRKQTLFFFIKLFTTTNCDGHDTSYTYFNAACVWSPSVCVWALGSDPSTPASHWSPAGCCPGRVRCGVC